MLHRAGRHEGDPGRRGLSSGTGRVLALLRLARFQTASLTGLAPIMGAVCAGAPSLAQCILLFGAGIGFHVYGFAYNEYRDREVDRLSADLAPKPLVAGSVGEKEALAFAGAGLALGLGATASATGSVAATGIALLATACATLYNHISKRVPFSDWAVALSMGLLVLVGGLAIGEITPLVWVVFGLMTLQLLLQNTLAHLKDLPQDAAAGGTNAALALGVLVEGEVVRVPPAFTAYVGTLRALHLGLAILGVLLLPGARALPLAILLATQAWGLHAFTRLVHRPPSRRRDYLARLFRHEFPTLLAITVILLARTGWIGLLPFVVLPVLWGVVSMRLLHGGEMPAL